LTWLADQDGEERLASRWGTFFIRFIWPIFGLGSIPGFLISLLWWRPDHVSHLVGAAVAALVVMPAYYLLVARPLRWVWAGADGLRLSDGRREARVPYSAIEDVRGLWYARDLVRVALRTTTPVGRRFLFIPASRRLLWGGHPVVARLRERAGLSGPTVQA
jgi:hypothetical protein